MPDVRQEEDDGCADRFGSLAAIPQEKITDKITRRVLAGEKGMMVWWDIKMGTHAAAHSHPHEQIVWMIKGKCEARIGTERRVVNPGRCVGNRRRARGGRRAGEPFQEALSG